MREITPQLFTPLKKNKPPEAMLSPPGKIPYHRDAWLRLKQNKAAMAGLAIIALLSFFSLAGPLLSGHTYDGQNLQMINRPPCGAYWFGTDSLGRDLFTRVWYGARISLAIGLATSLISLAIGAVYGGISGYAGGRVDEVMMRILEILNSIPFILYVILLMVLLEPGLKTIFIALGLVFWLNMARIVRGQVLLIKEQEYVLAARLLGAGAWRIIFRHLLPNTMGPVIVTMTLLVPEAIFTEAFLSFLGLGAVAPMASWGVLASDGIQGLRNYPWQLFFPAFLISLTILAFNFLGDGLRDALDPRSRN